MAFGAWRDEGISPLCWRFGTTTGVVHGHCETIPELFRDVRSRDEGLYVPIRLKIGVGRDRVIDDAIAQMKRIADKMLKSPELVSWRDGNGMPGH